MVTENDKILYRIFFFASSPMKKPTQEKILYPKEDWEWLCNDFKLSLVEISL